MIKSTNIIFLATTNKCHDSAQHKRVDRIHNNRCNQIINFSFQSNQFFEIYTIILAMLHRSVMVNNQTQFVQIAIIGLFKQSSNIISNVQYQVDDKIVTVLRGREIRKNPN